MGPRGELFQAKGAELAYAQRYGNSWKIVVGGKGMLQGSRTNDETWR